MRFAFEGKLGFVNPNYPLCISSLTWFYHTLLTKSGTGGMWTQSSYCNFFFLLPVNAFSQLHKELKDNDESDVVTVTVRTREKSLLRFNHVRCNESTQGPPFFSTDS